MKFHLNSFNGCQLTERTRNSIANDQKEITWFMSDLIGFVVTWLILTRVIEDPGSTS